MMETKNISEQILKNVERIYNEFDEKYGLW